MNQHTETRGQRFIRLFVRAVRLRCPFCGKGRLFRHWLRMTDRCSHCERSFEREAGFFLGSIYINYGLTALLIAVVYPVLLFNQVASNNTLLFGSLAFSVVFPIWFFRYARSLWLGFDQFVDPRE